MASDCQSAFDYKPVSVQDADLGVNSDLSRNLCWSLEADVECQKETFNSHLYFKKKKKYKNY